MTFETLDRFQRSATFRCVVLVVVVGCLPSAPYAAIAQTVFTDKDVFLAALPPGSAVAINDWESDLPGVLVPSGTPICEAVLTYAIADIQGSPLRLQVFDFFDATTPTNYLGPENPAPPLGLFLPGDALALTFDPAVEALGVQFVTSPGALEGILHIEGIIGGTPFIANSGPLTSVLSDGSEPYFLGIVTAPANGMTEATLFADDALLAFSLDEIIFQCTVPAFIDGDLNLDGFVDLNDVPVFVDVLLYYADPCDIATGDLNGDAVVDGGDIQGFVALLTGG